MISRFVGSSPASGSVLTARGLEPASESVSPFLSAPPLLVLCLINKHLKNELCIKTQITNAQNSSLSVILLRVTVACVLWLFVSTGPEWWKCWHFADRTSRPGPAFRAIVVMACDCPQLGSERRGHEETLCMTVRAALTFFADYLDLRNVMENVLMQMN